jgi:hypothetical protein
LVIVILLLLFVVLNKLHLLGQKHLEFLNQSLVSAALSPLLVDFGLEELDLLIACLTLSCEVYVLVVVVVG